MNLIADANRQLQDLTKTTPESKCDGGKHSQEKKYSHWQRQSKYLQERSPDVKRKQLGLTGIHPLQRLQVNEKYWHQEGNSISGNGHGGQSLSRPIYHGDYYHVEVYATDNFNH